jgi:hypothetical protein
LFTLRMYNCDEITFKIDILECADGLCDIYIYIYI